MLWSKHWHKFFRILCTNGIIIVGVEKVNKCNMLMEKINVTFYILLIPFMVRIRRIWVDDLDWDF